MRDLEIWDEEQIAAYRARPERAGLSLTGTASLFSGRSYILHRICYTEKKTVSCCAYGQDVNWLPKGLTSCFLMNGKAAQLTAPAADCGNLSSGILLQFVVCPIFFQKKCCIRNHTEVVK